MASDSLAKATEYYTLIGDKNAEALLGFLDPEVTLKSPLSSLRGRDAVVAAIRNFMNTFRTLTIRTKFGSGDQAIVIYDTDIPGVAVNFPATSLLTFSKGLIVSIELFFDGSHFTMQR